MHNAKSMFPALALAAIAALGGAPEASADNSSLIGRWTCTGQSHGMAFVSHFDYRGDGSYSANQQITVSPGNMIEGGGGGA